VHGRQSCICSNNSCRLQRFECSSSSFNVPPLRRPESRFRSFPDDVVRIFARCGVRGCRDVVVLPLRRAHARSTGVNCMYVPPPPPPHSSRLAGPIRLCRSTPRCRHVMDSRVNLICTCPNWNKFAVGGGVGGGDHCGERETV